MKNLIINTCNLIFIKSATAKTSNFVECKTKASNHFVSKTKRATFSINTILLMFLLLWLASTDIKAATFTVNLATDAVDANPADSICDANLVAPGLQCTLRAAIQQANTSLGVDDIAFSLGAANAINLTIGELPITSNMNINGPGARLLTVQRASGAANFRVFFVQTASTATVNISGITIANGYLNASGAGINNTGATLNLTEVTVRNNVAFGGLGGGIFNGSGGKLNLVRSTVKDNTALQGGGINNNSSTATANIVNSTISNNSANDN